LGIVPGKSELIMRLFLPSLALLPLIFASEGVSGQVKLYGTTSAGGDSSAGVIFSISSDGTHYQKLYSFKGGMDGVGPDGALAMGVDTKLYGLTTAGGRNNGGSVFAYDTAAHVYQKLADLSAATGYDAAGSLVWFNNKFFGLAVLGGANGDGTIFSYDPVAGSVSDVYDLTTETGSQPFGRITVVNNLLYFATNTGGTNNGGVLDVYDPVAGTVTALNNFPSGSAVWSSMAVMNNILYGVAPLGGTNNLGSVYSYDPNGGGYKDLFDYDIFYNGVYPYGVVPYHGLLYGSTVNGGVNQTGGTLNYVNPATGGHSQFYSFDYNNNRTDGGFPYGVPVITADGLMLGMTEMGGTADSGIIYSYDLNTSTFTKLMDFTGPNGALPVMNGLFLPGDAVSLPIRILSFTGLLTEAGRVLNWTASQPAPGGWFQLERSTDEVSYAAIDSLAAAGVADRVASYSYTDAEALPGISVVYYRLKMMEVSGSTSNSQVVAVGLGGSRADSLRLINTVVTGTAFLQYTSVRAQAALNARVLSMGGELMISQQLPVSVGVNSYSLDLSGLPKGMYVLQVAGRSFSFLRL
jgi:uncharacterized repeat protein (TIGR03803 family)